MDSYSGRVYRTYRRRHGQGGSLPEIRCAAPVNPEWPLYFTNADERALFGGRHIFGWHFFSSNRENQMKSIGLLG
jgi:hypothetical protein